MSGDGDVFATKTSAQQVVPEPSSLALLAIGVTGLCGYRWRRKRPLVALSAGDNLAHSKT